MAITYSYMATTWLKSYVVMLLQLQASQYTKSEIAFLTIMHVVNVQLLAMAYTIRMTIICIYLLINC